jgi:hypothetical protein
VRERLCVPSTRTSASGFAARTRSRNGATSLIVPSTLDTCVNRREADPAVGDQRRRRIEVELPVVGQRNVADLEAQLLRGIG